MPPELEAAVEAYFARPRNPEQERAKNATARPRLEDPRRERPRAESQKASYVEQGPDLAV
jgi:hypothetical protein